MTNLGTHMYNWVINYNPYTQLWQAAERDNSSDLYSSRKDCVTSSSLMTLVEILNKTNGDEDEINKLING